MAYKTGSATDYIDLLDKLVAFCLARRVASVAIADDGAAYTAGDILTLSGGTPEISGQVHVDTVGGGGEILTCHVEAAGLYCNGATPGDPVSVTGGTGAGAQFNVTWEGALGWTQQRNSVWGGSDKEVILKGDASGAMDFYVGVRTYNDGGGTGAYNWELAGMTGYSGGSSWETQPGISPGRSALQQNTGAYVPLRNAAITYWFFVNSRRIICVFKVGTVYASAYLGLLNPYATATEYPYPLAVIGNVSTWNRLYSTPLPWAGLIDPSNDQNTDVGVAYLRDPGGNWYSILNAKYSGSARAASKMINVFPCGTMDTARVATNDYCSNLMIAFDKYAPYSGSPTYVMKQLPGDVSLLIPNFVYVINPYFSVLGEIDSIFWVSASATPANLISEDTVTIGGDVYIVFQEGQRTEGSAYCAIKRG